MKTSACVLVLLALACAGQLRAQTDVIETTPVIEGKAEPGKEWTLKLRFEIPAGYHAYHKDNPGTGLPILVEFSELSGLKEVRQTWPMPRKHKTEFGEEWDLDGTVEIAWTFKVPDNASGKLAIAGSADIQFCDDEGCRLGTGKFDTSVEVTGAAAPAATEKDLAVSAAFEGDAAPGGKAVLAVTFTARKGWHAYHKDNPASATGVPLKVTLESGVLKLASESWPEPHKIDRWGIGSVDWELEGTFVVRYTFDVPADASGTINVKGKFDGQVCEEVCVDVKGEFAATLTVAAPQPPKSANDAKDKHGFYLDFDFAMAEAKRLGKPLLVDFNGKFCPPCRAMEATVFTRPEVKKLFENFVIVSLITDIDDAKADALWSTYRPGDNAGVPYYAVLDHDGKLQRGSSSTLPADKKAHLFVSFLKGEAPAPTPTPNVDAEAPRQNGWPEKLFPAPGETISKGMTFEAAFTAPKVKPGAEVTLELRFKMLENEEGETYHTYHPGTKATDINIPLKVEWVSDGGLNRVGELAYPEPALRKDDGLGEEWLLPAEFKLLQKFTVPVDMKTGVIRIYGHVSGQYCDSNGCVFFNASLATHPNRKFGWVATVEISPEGAASAVAPMPAGGDGSLSSQVQDKGLFVFLFIALMAGMVTLLTPCVLPVLPLTVGFFVSQAEKGRSPLLTAAIYCACIMGSFILFGLITSFALGAGGAQNIATNGWVNTFLALMFLVFALSFLGLFELRVPAFMTAWFSRKQMVAQKEGRGYAKAFFSGTAFSLISFSCTVPIAGGFLLGAATAESVGDIWLPTLTMIAFSAGLAIPIFIMGQFPALMKRLPKSGGWMNAMKVVFGFIEIGLAIMYISAAEQAFKGVIAAEWINRYVVIAVWAAVSLASAIYLFGFFRMPHDHEKTEQIGVVRGLFAVLFLSFGLYMIPGLFGAKYGSTLEGILPPPPAEGGITLGGGGKGNDAHDLPWTPDLVKGLEIAAKVNKPVFIDFTGFN